MPEYKVKGSTVRNKFAYVESNFGSSAIENMTREFKKRYGDTIFPILNSTWYAFDVYVEILEYIAEHHYGGDMKKLEEVGKASAEDALKNIYSSFVHNKEYLEFLKKISKLHKMFYNEGKTDVIVHDNQKGCDIIHTDKSKYAEADMHVAAGFYQESAKLHDLKNISCSFTFSRTEARFTLTWA